MVTSAVASMSSLFVVVVNWSIGSAAAPIVNAVLVFVAIRIFEFASPLKSMLDGPEEVVNESVPDLKSIDWPLNSTPSTKTFAV